MTFYTAEEIAQRKAVVSSTTADLKAKNKQDSEEKRRKCKEDIRQLERRMEEITLEHQRRDEALDRTADAEIAELETSKEYLIKAAESLKEAAAARLALPWALSEVDKRAFELLFHVIEYNNPEITSSESAEQEIEDEKAAFFEFLDLVERKDEDMNMRTLMDLFLEHNNF